MSQPVPLNRQPKANPAALDALEQMFGYYAYPWQPFAPAQSPVEKQAA